MPKLYLFNPGHEEALPYASQSSYTPTKIVRHMMREQWASIGSLAQQGDYIARLDWDSNELTLFNPQLQEVKDCKTLPPLQLSPWALEPHTINKVSKLAYKQGIQLLLPNIPPPYLEASHRSVANKVLDCFTSYYPELTTAIKRIKPQWFYPQRDDWQKSLDEYLARYRELGSLKQGDNILVLKRPYTSSGRGVFALKYERELRQNIIKMGLASPWGFSLEPYCAIIQNLSFLYYATPNACSLRYITSFVNKPGGFAYSAHSSLLDKLPCEAIQFREFYQTALPHYLQQLLDSSYEGWIGIDAFLYKSTEATIALQPCCEVNLRCTMGVLYALEQSQLLDSIDLKQGRK